MNRQEFMNRLEYLLRGIPASEREDALAYYNDYFDEAGAENEAQVIQELGNPEVVAANILANVQQENSQHESKTYSNEKKKMSKSTKILLVILLILTFPIWICVVAGLFSTVVGLIGALFGIVVGFISAAVGLVAGGVVCIFGGILCAITVPVEGLVSIGVGALLAALGVLMAVPCVWTIGVWIPKGVKALIGWTKGLFHRQKGGNEI